MSWESGKRFRFKAVPGQVLVARNPTTGTPSVEIMLECSHGPQVGQRIRWKGYLNTNANGETAIAEMRAMGWRGQKLGDWAGLGNVEFEASTLSEVGKDGKTYWRAAWPRALATVKTEKSVDEKDLADLNGQLGGLFTKLADPLPPAPVVSEAGADGEIPF